MANETRNPIPCIERELERPVVAFAVIENALNAVVAIGGLTESDAGICGGRLTFLGTGFTVGQFIAEVADDGVSVRNVCDNYDLDPDQVVAVLHAIAAGFSAPVV